MLPVQTLRSIAKKRAIAKKREDLSFVVLTMFFVSLMLGCHNGPGTIRPPAIDAKDAAAEAIELYDSDDDDSLDSEELKAVPGLQAAMATVDTNNDNMASESEIAGRIRSWQASRAGLTAILCKVTLNGRLLPDATVTFEPESFLGEELQTAVGTTNRYGIASPSIPKENRPTADMPPGIQLGFFRVRVSKIVDGKETIPARYNSETTLGQQVANDDPALIRMEILIKLETP